MVSVVCNALFWLLAQVNTPRQITEPTRTMALMALLAIALLGMLLVVFILLGGHWVRRQGTHRRGPAVPPDLVLRRGEEDDNPNPTDPSADAPTDETLVSDDTQCR